MKNQPKYFIFEIIIQRCKTSPRLLYVGCNVLKEIESPDGIKVSVNLGGETTHLFSILSGLFVVLLASKYTSCNLHRLVRVKFTTLHKWLCYKLLTTTETTTVNDTTAERNYSSYFRKGVRGVASFPHLSSFTHSGWCSPFNSLS